MPIEKTANFIRIRVANPKKFIRFRVKLLGKGIKAVIGFKKGGGSQVQSFLFPRTRYTLSSARAWIKKQNYKVSETAKAFAVFDINVTKHGEAMFIEAPIEIEETEKKKKTNDVLFNETMELLRD